MMKMMMWYFSAVHREKDVIFCLLMISLCLPWTPSVLLDYFFFFFFVMSAYIFIVRINVYYCAKDDNMMGCNNDQENNYNVHLHSNFFPSFRELTLLLLREKIRKD